MKLKFKLTLSPILLVLAGHAIGIFPQIIAPNVTKKIKKLSTAPIHSYAAMHPYSTIDVNVIMIT